VEFPDIQKSNAAHSGGFPGIDQQLVLHGRAVAAAAAPEEFELLEAFQMHAHLELAPAGSLADVAAGEMALALAVVVKRMATGPCTWYSWVSMRPLRGSLPVLAMVRCRVGGDLIEQTFVPSSV